MNEIIQSTLVKLRESSIPNPELEMRILLKEASINKKEIVLSNLNINNINLNYFKSLISKRLKRKPISKIINKKYFWKSEFFVNSDVLDPRPESELIIEETLNNIKDKNKKLNILDIGTGSGCLAISLANEFKNSKITAIDISKKSIDVAKKNVDLHNLKSQIKVDLLDIKNIKKKYDVIVSNPPYISEFGYKKLQLEIVKYEPKLALIGGKDGLKYYKIFAKKLEKIMNNNSYFICEIGFNQLASCKKIFENSNLKLKKITKDIQNIDRTLTFFKI